jgi:hypothetical protein
MCKQPDILYHYCSLDTFLKIIENGSVRLSDLSQSNDAQEGRYVIKLLDGHFDQMSLPNKLIGILKDFFAQAINHIGALGFCLSENGDLLSQWRGYGDDGRGVALGFNSFALELCAREHGEMRGVKLADVKYGIGASDNLISNVCRQIEELNFEKIDLAEFSDELTLQYIISGYAAKERAPKLTELVAAKIAILAFNLGQQCFEFKNDAFKEELEWRLLRERNIRNGSEIAYHARGSRIVAFQDVPFGDSLQSIVLGPKCEVPEQEMRLALTRFGQKGFGDEKITITKSVATYR